MAAAALGPGSGKRTIARLAAELDQEFNFLLRHDFRLEPLAPVCISHVAIFDVARSSFQAISDLRNQYPNTLSLLKYISNVMFWIVKLKPINSSALIAGDDLVIVEDVNEQLAVYWGMKKFVQAVDHGKLAEIIDPSPKNKRRVHKVIRTYLTENIYRKPGTKVEIPNTVKYDETIFYLRYKKITAVNIYEMMLHMVVAYRTIG